MVVEPMALDGYATIANNPASAMMYGLELWYAASFKAQSVGLGLGPQAGPSNLNLSEAVLACKFGCRNNNNIVLQARG